MYHRKVTLPRIRKEEKERRRNMEQKCLGEEDDDAVAVAGETTPLMENLDRSHRQGEESFERLKRASDAGGGSGKEAAMTKEEVDALGASGHDSEGSSSSGEHRSSTSPPPARRSMLSIPDRFAMLMSNYDPASVQFDYSLSPSGSEEDISKDGVDDGSELERVAAAIHDVYPGIRHSSRRMTTVFEDWGREESTSIRPSFRSSVGHWPDQSSATDPRAEGCKWSVGMFADAYEELAFHYHNFVRDSFRNETSSFSEKMGLILELPFVAVRTVRGFGVFVTTGLCVFLRVRYSLSIPICQVTIPVPCEEHYCRPILVSADKIMLFFYFSFISLWIATAYDLMSLMIL